MALSLNSEHFTEILSNVRPLEMIMQTLWWLEVRGGGGGGKIPLCCYVLVRVKRWVNLFACLFTIGSLGERRDPGLPDRCCGVQVHFSKSFFHFAVLFLNFIFACWQGLCMYA